MKLQLVLLALLLVPLAVQGQTTSELIWADGQEGHLMKWRIGENSTDSPFTSITFPVSWLKFHSMEKAIQQSIVFVDISATHVLGSSSTGSYRYQVSINGTNVPNCFWELTTQSAPAAVAGVLNYPNYEVHCATVGEFQEDQVFNVTITRTVVSGTPAPVRDTYLSLSLDRADFVVYPMQIETALDQYIPALFWGGLIIFSMTRTAILPALAATMGFLGAFLPSGQGIAFLGAVFLYVVALWLHASTKTKLWVEAARPFKKRNEKP